MKSLGGSLILRQGSALTEITKLARETKATHLYFNRRYEHLLYQNDLEIEDQLRKEGLEVKSFPGNVIIEPNSLKTQQDKAYQVFSPFYRAFLSHERLSPVAKCGPIKAPAKLPKSLRLNDLSLLPNKEWSKEMMAHWTPDVAGARSLFKSFCQIKVSTYKEGRDFPSLESTSRLSPYLHFGQVSPRRIWEYLSTPPRRSPGAQHFLRELAWREFAQHLIFHFKNLENENLRKDFDRFPWREGKTAERDFDLWKKGKTGYPLVDAGMRELWATGWMHNRVRMVVASFLVKHLRIDWKRGAEWFWDTLVDADLPNNTLGWQWAAGSGPDAAPYFRIFNPILQSQKFDSEGKYIQHWVSELKNMSASQIHEPWKFGKPKPMIDHAFAREAALEAYSKIKGKK
jgi:deoxyribodipyrimidine photo-lyase